MEPKRITIIIAAIVFLSVGISAAKRKVEQTRQGADPAQVKIIQSAQAKFDKGDYAGAKADAAKFIESFPASALCADAQYLIALSYLREGNEPAAREELDRLIKNYPNFSKVAEAASTLRTLEAKRFQEIIGAQQNAQAQLEEENKKLTQAVESMRQAANEDKLYLVIDVKADMIMVKIGPTTLYAFPCATGKDIGYLSTTGMLTKFTTPRGKHKIIAKVENPIWYRPNWWWLERGEDVPEGITWEQRGVEGKLGKYKLDFGDQFYIHGYEGHVNPGKYTHGCVRVNDDDLQVLWNLTEVGTYVYIF